MHGECRERFPRHRLQRKPQVSDPAMHHCTRVTHVPWCPSGSLTRCGGENLPGIPGACATRNFVYLLRGTYTIQTPYQLIWDLETRGWTLALRTWQDGTQLSPPLSLPLWTAQVETRIHAHIALKRKDKVYQKYPRLMSLSVQGRQYPMWRCPCLRLGVTIDSASSNHTPEHGVYGTKGFLSWHGCAGPFCRYRKFSNIRRTLVGNKIVDHSDVVGASPVGAAPTTSSFSTWHLASRDSRKTAAKTVRESFKCWD